MISSHRPRRFLAFSHAAVPSSSRWMTCTAVWENLEEAWIATMPAQKTLYRYVCLPRRPPSQHHCVQLLLLLLPPRQCELHYQTLSKLHQVRPRPHPSAPMAFLLQFVAYQARKPVTETATRPRQLFPLPPPCPTNIHPLPLLAPQTDSTTPSIVAHHSVHDAQNQSITLSRSSQPVAIAYGIGHVCVAMSVPGLYKRVNWRKDRPLWQQQAPPRHHWQTTMPAMHVTSTAGFVTKSTLDQEA